ncbi:JAB domain-containing protein [Caldithrix abyssi]|uniref:DNA repair protein RadC n=1 Tax=Caldithrix abyssi DSM 13497 TaxID=880073 RepID=H1XUR5_CALAY|nr:DNA repair protein RadC [Caldithrix abyssi]APF17518.1 DNA repair protein RadC [Caldithrix abyssi DSM 13497]EHO41614.1 DNA repair protein RadC [Caldithrix abyssi DSM 13497]
MEKYKPHYLNHRTRLRKRFLENGLSALQDYEIIELFLTFVIPQKDVKPQAKEIIDKFGSIKGFFDADEDRLKEVKFFKDKAIALRRFIKEISLLYQKQLVEEKPLTQSREELIKFCINKLGFKKEEEFWMISLDSKYSIIEENLISRGLTDKAPVYPRKIIEQALQQKAHAVLLLHNHPNGNPRASEHDITITRAIIIPAKVLNLKVYDHIIVAGDNYFSFKEEGLL